MKIAVIMGGHQSEHGISLRSGEAVKTALAPHVESIKSVVIDSNLKTWRIDDEPFHPTVALKTLSSSVDVSYIAIHGPFGEDGTLQGALEVVDARYTGSGVNASAVAMNKVASAGIMMSQGYKVPPFVNFAKNDIDKAFDQIKELEWPLVLKPINSGSSVGVEFIENKEQLRAAVTGNPFVQLMVQKYVEGTEVAATVVDLDNGLVPLPIVEIRPKKDQKIINFETKYDSDMVEQVCPATLSSDICSQVQQFAIDACRNIGCRSIARNDFIIDKNNEIWYLETNTSPSLEENSLTSKMMEAANLDIGETLFKLCQKAAVKV